MLVLELTADMIGASRDRLTLAYIEAVMLWPDSDTDRKRAITASRAEEFLARAASLPASQPIQMTAGDFLLVARRLKSAPSIADEQKAAEMRSYRGMLAGWIFDEAIKDRRTGGKRGLQVVKRTVFDRVAGRHPQFNISMGTLEATVWKPYRGVAHLWASSLRMNEDRAALKQRPQFPCRLDDLERFLGIAEAFREEAAATTGRHAPSLQDPETTWRVPKCIALPRWEISWPG